MIETERLLLRRFTMDDLDDLAAIFAKPEVFWYPAKRGYSREETAEMLQKRFIDRWDEQDFGLFAVIRRSDERLLGYTGLAIPYFLPEVLPAVELGYRYDPDAWGRGYATEASASSLDYGFDTVGLDRIIAIYHPENVRSGDVMRRLGMKVERDTVHPTDGDPLRVYEIFRDEWRARGRRS
ncbi:MAG TPA: GNAT family N-acetyltransferase [Actinomycetota bacterium]|nr:GNAT family N-acetyltransferase [Actinomycetota bacterium]